MTPLIDIISKIGKQKVITGSTIFNSNYSSSMYNDISISGITDISKCVVEITNNPTAVISKGKYSTLITGYAVLLDKTTLRVYRPIIESVSTDASNDYTWTYVYPPCTLQWKITQYY